MELQNTVKQALNMLYHHPDDAVRMEADRWLQKFQRTIDAWQSLLSREIGSANVYEDQVTKNIIIGKGKTAKGFGARV